MLDCIRNIFGPCLGFPERIPLLGENRDDLEASCFASLLEIKSTNMIHSGNNNLILFQRFKDACNLKLEGKTSFTISSLLNLEKDLNNNIGMTLPSLYQGVHTYR